LEYAYDLTGLKAGLSGGQAGTELDAASARALADGLPETAHVVVDLSGAALSLDVASEREVGEPVPSFATALAGERVRAGPLDARPGPRLLPGLHPDVPRVLPSVDVLAWKARVGTAALLAGMAAALDSGAAGGPLGLRAFWTQVAESAARRIRLTEGDAQEGAVMLAAHVVAALERQGPVPQGVLKLLAGEPSAPVLKERRALAASVQPSALEATFSQALHGQAARDAVLELALPESRAGKAAALTFLLLLEQDAKLRDSWAGWQGFRRRAWGASTLDVLAGWGDVVKTQGGAAASLEDFPACVAALQRARLRSPPLVATLRSPLEAQLEGLGGAGSSTARGDLVHALEGIPREVAEGAAWLEAVDAAFAALVATPDAADLPRREVSGRYRERLGQALLATWPLPAVPADPPGGEVGLAEAPPAAARVALMVPPHLAYEPAGAFLERMAQAQSRLVTWLEQETRLGGAPSVRSDGSRGGTLRAEAAGLRDLYRGLWLLARAAPADSPADTAALARAQSFVQGWRDDVDLGQDVRVALPLPGAGAVLVHGVSRQELRVGWLRLPRVESVDLDPRLGVYAERRASQKYLLPLLVTGHAPGMKGVPARKPFRALSDKHGRRPDAVEAALQP
jgi:hypothetical protein